MECKVCTRDNPPEARFCGNCGAALATTAGPPSPVAPEPRIAPIVAVEYMGFWIRFVAAIIDSVIVWVFFGVLSSLAYILPVSVILLVGPLSYYWLFTGLKGQTPGKMLVGIKVVNVQGNRPGLASAALREIPGKLVSAIVFFLGFLWIAWDRQKQGWHDKIAITYVVKAEPRRLKEKGL